MPALGLGLDAKDPDKSGVLEPEMRAAAEVRQAVEAVEARQTRGSKDVAAAWRLDPGAGAQRDAESVGRPKQAVTQLAWAGAAHRARFAMREDAVTQRNQEQAAQ